MQKIIQGNLDELEPKHKGWFMGYFMDDGSCFKTKDFEIKWGEHKAGEEKPKVGTQKIAKTLTIIIEGKFKVNFPKENKKIILTKKGDYLFYDAGVAHSWRAIENTTIISIRWPSIPGDQI